MSHARSVASMLSAKAGIDARFPFVRRLVAAASVAVLAAVATLVTYRHAGPEPGGPSATAAQPDDPVVPANRPDDFWYDFSGREDHPFRPLMAEVQELMRRKSEEGTSPELRGEAHAMLARWPLEDIVRSEKPDVHLLLAMVQLTRMGGEASHLPFLEAVERSTWYPANRQAAKAIEDIDLRCRAAGPGGDGGAPSSAGAGGERERAGGTRD